MKSTREIQEILDKTRQLTSSLSVRRELQCEPEVAEKELKDHLEKNKNIKGIKKLAKLYGDYERCVEMKIKEDSTSAFSNGFIDFSNCNDSLSFINHKEKECIQNNSFPENNDTPTPTFKK